MHNKHKDFKICDNFLFFDFIFSVDLGSKTQNCWNLVLRALSFFVLQCQVYLILNDQCLPIFCANVFYNLLKMIKIFLLLFVVPIFISVKASNDICLKAYKKKLCLKVSVQKYEMCLFQQFNVFESNNKFCVTNLKCVSKILTCPGLFL